MMAEQVGHLPLWPEEESWAMIWLPHFSQENFMKLRFLFESDVNS